MASDFSVTWQNLSKRKIVFSFWIKLHALVILYLTNIQTIKILTALGSKKVGSVRHYFRRYLYSDVRFSHTIASVSTFFDSFSSIFV
jgi:hypothetical protein